VPLLALWDAGSGAGSTRREINNVYLENEDIIYRLANVSSIESKNAEFQARTPELGWGQAGGPFFAIIYEAQIDAVAERERLTKEVARLEKISAGNQSKLGNEGFLAKAPAHIVDGLKKQEAETRTLLEKARDSLEALPK
jgi:valyl-tRNA synthetase